MAAEDIPTRAGPPTHTAHHIADLAGPWSPLVDTLYALPNWLRTAEERAAGDHRYAVVEDPSGPTGALVSYDMGAGAWFFNDPVALLCQSSEAFADHLDDAERAALEEAGARLRAVRDSLYPAAVSVLPSGYRPGLLRRPDAGDGVLDVLLTHLEEGAQRQGLPTVAVMHVPESDRPLRERLVGRGYLPFVSVGDCVLTIRWDDFDQYLSELPSHKQMVRREIAAFARSGAVLQEATVADMDGEHARLHHAHLRRYGHDVTLDGSLNLIRNIQQNPTGRGRVVEARRKGELVGFVVAYEHDRVLHPKMIGIADGERRSATYFNVFFYGVLRIAISERVRSVVYGPEAYQAKAIRGCDLEKLLTHVRLPAGARDLAAPVATLLDRAQRRRLDSHPWAAARTGVPSTD